MKILILDGDNFQALRLVRDLGNNHTVFIGGKSKKTTLAYYSKYCDQFVSYSDDSINSFTSVLTVIETYGIELIIPTTERSCIILSHYRMRIEAISNCVIAMDKFERLQIAFDKSKTFEFCEKYDIPTPKIEFLDSSKLNSKIVVLKYISSNLVLNDGSIAKTHSPQYFTNDISRLNFDNSKFFQEFIRGESVGYFAICKRGEILDAYSHIRILDTNPSGSGSCVRKNIVNLQDDLNLLSKKIISKLEWNGPIMLEFLKDESNKYYLLEINGRLWGSYCLSSFSGKNFTSKLISLFNNQLLNVKSETKELIVTNEILLIYRWFRILKGPDKFSSEKFPSRFKILSELKYLLEKRELFSDYDPLPIFRFLWKK